MKTATATIFLSLGMTLHAAPTLHPLFSDRAVLQRDVVLPVFGAAKQGEKITVLLGDRSATAQADARGQWRVEFPPAPASTTPVTLEARGEDGAPAKADAVLFGDVWLLGGQSNMRHPFKTYGLLAGKTKSVNDPDLRLLIVNGPPPQEAAKAGAPVPPKLLHPVCQDAWQPAVGGPCLEEFSPAGYFFGESLRRELQVPVGLVLSAVGGTMIERWLPPEEAAKVKLSAFATDGPSDLYNLMIEPLRGFAFRGMAWYQGESNGKDPVSYGPLLEALIAGWRRELNVADRPFIIVQIAPFAGAPGQITPESWAWLREQQSLVALRISQTGLVVTLDLGEAEDIHPQNKQPVGHRMAWWALRDAGNNVQAASPRYQSYEVHGSDLVLSFTDTAGGLKTQRVAMNRKKNLPFCEDPEAAVAPADQLVGFQICGDDRVFHPADARIDSDKVTLSSPAVPQPVAARYAWDNFPLGNLFGGTGLPAEPFRTDDFPPPDFGLPVDGAPAPDHAPGQALSFLEGKENPYGPSAEVDGREAYTFLKTRKPEVKFQGRYVYAKVPEGSAEPGWPVIVSVVYRDDFRNIVKVRYDSSDESVVVNPNNPGAFKDLGSFRMTGSGQWRMAEFEVKDGRFRQRCNGADIRLESLPDRDLVIGGVYVRPAG